MDTKVTADELLAATRSVAITFDGVPAEPVAVADPAAVTDAEAARIVGRYETHGFAIMQLASEQLTHYTLIEVATSLGLGKPYVPPLYTMGGKQAPKVARISAAHNAGTADAGHPSFGRTVGQRLHCDGTLQDIGYVKAALLLCQAPAAEGGHTILFNSSAAFCDLVRRDLPAATALATPGTLVRQANINGCTDSNVGPTFAVHDGKLVGRYSVTETDSWAEPAGVVAEDLRRGIDFLASASQPGSPYFTRLRLDRGQVIVFDNTRISHGRTSYVDSPTQRRCMYRSLHLRHPRLLSERNGVRDDVRGNVG
jgi:Taurine catabolism dioxygenase TauD, TfdA family